MPFGRKEEKMDNTTNTTTTVTDAPKKRGRKPGQKGHCSYCGEEGHYARTCPKRKAELEDQPVVSEAELDTAVNED